MDVTQCSLPYNNVLRTGAMCVCWMRANSPSQLSRKSEFVNEKPWNSSWLISRIMCGSIGLNLAGSLVNSVSK